MRSLKKVLGIAIAFLLSTQAEVHAAIECAQVLNGLGQNDGVVCAEAYVVVNNGLTLDVSIAASSPTSAAVDGKGISPPPEDYTITHRRSGLLTSAEKFFNIRSTSTLTVEPDPATNEPVRVGGSSISRVIWNAKKPGAGVVPIKVSFSANFELTDPIINLSNARILYSAGFSATDGSGPLANGGGAIDFDTDAFFQVSAQGDFFGNNTSVGACASPDPSCKKININFSTQFDVNTGERIDGIFNDGIEMIFSDGIESGDNGVLSYASPNSTAFTIDSPDPDVTFEFVSVVVPLPGMAWLFAAAFGGLLVRQRTQVKP